MKSHNLYTETRVVALGHESFFIDEDESNFDDNWIVSANDLFGTFDLTDEIGSAAYLDLAA
jgi:hypothetical protein